MSTREFADGVVSLALAVVLPTADVYGCGALITGYPVARMEVEPNVADLEGGHLGHTEAADGSEGDEQAVTIVPEAVGAHPKECGHEEPVDGEQQGGGLAKQARQAA
jgi:hypothetical protein